MAIAISNVTDCINGACTAHYSTEITTTLSQGYRACVRFNELKNDNRTVFDGFDFTLNVMKAGYEVPIELQYVTSDLHPTFNTYCTCSIARTVYDCNNMNFTSSPKIEFCKISSQNTKTCLIHGNYHFAQRVGYDMQSRYKVFLTRTSVPEISLTYEFQNLTTGIIWNGLTPTHVPLSSEVSFDLLSANYMTNIIYPKYIVLDMKKPFDLYDATGFNVAGEFSIGKLGHSYWLPNGLFKTRTLIYEEATHGTLDKCDGKDSRGQLYSNWNRIDSYLENKRMGKDSLRNTYPKLMYYDENSYSSNDYWTSGASIDSHTAIDQLIYGKQGKSVHMKNYIQAVTTSNDFVEIGYIWNNELDRPDQYFFNGNTPVGMQEFEIRQCNNSIITLRFQAGVGFEFYNLYTESYSQNNFTYLDWEYNCKWVTLNNIPEFVPVHDEPHHLFLPIEQPGSITFRITGTKEGLTFSTKCCPKIISIKDNSTDHTLIVQAKSNCGTGEAIVTTNNSLSHTSHSLLLTSKITTYEIPRVGNITGYSLFCLDSLGDSDCSSVKLSYFKTNVVIDNSEEDGTPVDPPKEDAIDNSIFGSASGFWNNIKDMFSWKFTSWQSILFKIIMYIILIPVGIIIIYLLIKIFIWLFKKIISKISSISKPTMKAKYI